MTLQLAVSCVTGTQTPQMGPLSKLSCWILEIANHKLCSPYPASGERVALCRPVTVLQEAEGKGHEVWPRMACVNVECHSDCHCVSFLSPFFFYIFTGKVVLRLGVTNGVTMDSPFLLSVMGWVLGSSGWPWGHFWRILGCGTCGSSSFSL